MTLIGVTARDEAVSRLMEEIAPLRRAGCTFTRIEHRVSPSKERWSKPMTEIMVSLRGYTLHSMLEEANEVCA
jgi:hypothetical protein